MYIVEANIHFGFFVQMYVSVNVLHLQIIAMRKHLDEQIVNYGQQVVINLVSVCICKM